MPSPPLRSEVPSANKKRTYTRRTSKERILAAIDTLREMVESHCDGVPKTPAAKTPKTPAAKTPKTRKATKIPTLVPYENEAPATMVPLTLDNAFAKPNVLEPTLATTLAAPTLAAPTLAAPTLAPATRRVKPTLRANQEGSWNKFLKNWMAAHPGMKRPDAMKAAGENWKAFKAGKAAPAPAAALPSVGELEEEAENLGLL